MQAHVSIFIKEMSQDRNLASDENGTLTRHCVSRIESRKMSVIPGQTVRMACLVVNTSVEATEIFGGSSTRNCATPSDNYLNIHRFLIGREGGT